MKEKLAASIQSAIQKAANFKTILPRVVETVVSIRSVQFREREDRLLLSLAADVRITPDQWPLPLEGPRSRTSFADPTHLVGEAAYTKLRLEAAGPIASAGNSSAARAGRV